MEQAVLVGCCAARRLPLTCSRRTHVQMAQFHPTSAILVRIRADDPNARCQLVRPIACWSSAHLLDLFS